MYSALVTGVVDAKVLKMPRFLRRFVFSEQTPAVSYYS